MEESGNFDLPGGRANVGGDQSAPFCLCRGSCDNKLIQFGELCVPKGEHRIDRRAPKEQRSFGGARMGVEFLRTGSRGCQSRVHVFKER